MYKSTMIKTAVLSCALLLMGGCSSTQVDPSDYPDRLSQRVMIPEICKPVYDAARPTVAVVDFVNNTTFTEADLASSDVRKDSAAVVGIGVGPTGAVAGGAATSHERSHAEQRSVDARLGESITPLIESLVINSGGAELFARGEALDKINEELKFQDSGLVDPDSVVGFGELSGAEFILTGSIDNASIRARDYSGAAEAAERFTSQSDNQFVQLAGVFGRGAAAMTDGTLVETTYTVSLVDVATGRIMHNRQYTKEVNIGQVENPTFDHYVGAINRGISESLPELQKDLNVYFGLKAYITQMRTDGKDAIAQINAGTNYNLREGDTFKVIVFEEIVDPFSDELTCDMITDRVKLTVSNQITQTHAWTIVDGDPSRLSIGQMVQKSAEEKGGLFGF